MTHAVPIGAYTRITKKMQPRRRDGLSFLNAALAELRPPRNIDYRLTQA